jgi:16S rRNA (guanine966-N2)-methyltransferase
MRVIAGKYRSRKLHTLRGLALRPSSDRLRETLFNILGPAIEDSVFVDLFAGSGAVGIEAISRNAREALFVENHAAAIALLRRNLESLGIPIAGARGPRSGTAFPGTAEILPLDAHVALERLIARSTRADFIFADPPYADDGAYETVLDLLGDSNLLIRKGALILEHARRHELPAIAGQLERTRVVEQGDSSLSFYHRLAAA